MSRLYNYLMDLKEQERRLVDQLYDLDQGLVPAGEIGSDAAVVMADLLEAINDIDAQIARIEKRA
jgi:hypothetical protein